MMMKMMMMMMTTSNGDFGWELGLILSHSILSNHPHIPKMVVAMMMMMKIIMIMMMRMMMMVKMNGKWKRGFGWEQDLPVFLHKSPALPTLLANNRHRDDDDDYNNDGVYNYHRNTRSVGAPPGPYTLRKALWASWLCLSRPPSIKKLKTIQITLVRNNVLDFGPIQLTMSEK